MMNPTQLAELSNAAVYSAVVALTLAMVAYALYLARLAPDRAAGRPSSVALAAADRTLAGVGARQPAWDGAASTGAAVDDAEAGTGAPPGPAGIGGEPVLARKAAGIAGALTLLGTLLLAAGVVLRVAEVRRPPLGNMYEFAVTGALFALIVYLGWSARRDLRWLGLFVVGPVVVDLGLAIAVWYTDASELVPSLRSVWLAVHVTIATVSVAVFTIGFSLGVLYLIRERMDRRGVTRSFMARLPDARRLERLSYTAHVVAFPLWTFTVIAGAIWARQAWGSYWNWDPKEVWSFVIWVVYAAYLHARATTGWARPRAVAIALAGFGCVILNFAVVNVFFVGQHSYSGL
jgi:cytochrome c-type biogenesis protein CcsB